MFFLKTRSIAVLFTLIFCLTSFVYTFAHSGPFVQEDKVVILNSVQKISFFIDKKNELQAKLTVKQTAKSQTNLQYRFKRYIFFDNYSEVREIREVLSKKMGKKIKPIISDYESDGIFHSDLKLCYFEHSFFKNGDTYTYRYEKVFKDLKFLESLYFNDSYPIQNSTLIIEIPDGVSVDIRELNFDKEKPSYESFKEKNKTIHTYSLSDVPAAFKFSGAPRRSKFNAHLILIPNAYEVNGKTVKLIEDVNDLYKWYTSIVSTTENNNSDLKAIVEELTEGKTDDLEKIKAIYYWVQDNIRYIAFEYGIMGFKPEACQEVYKNKYGDCKGMANLTKEMLRLAGYDARLTWLGTADVPYDYDIPSLVVDNHMICTVILNGEKIFLDPTEKYSDLYNYAFRIQGQQALIEDGESFMIERIPSLEADHNKEISEVTFTIDKEQIKGKGKLTFQGNRKTYIFYRLSSLPQKAWEEYLKNYIGNADKNVKVKLLTEANLNNRDSDFVLNYELDMEHHVIDLGEELYVNLEYDYPFKNFKISDERNVPYEFSGKYYIENISKLKIPEGWESTYLPEAIKNNKEHYTFELSFKEENGEVIYHKKIAIKDAFLDVENFEDWNKTIEQLNTFYGDQIILKKQ